jgi:HEPN domain-containing protein
MKSATLTWVRFATLDMQAAEKLVVHNYLGNVVLFHCRQAVEKIFKAVLEEHDIKVPKIHGLLKLHELLPENIRHGLGADLQDLEKLEDSYVESRYPTDLGTGLDLVPSSEDIRWFYETAKRIFIDAQNLLP